MKTQFTARTALFVIIPVLVSYWFLSNPDWLVLFFPIPLDNMVFLWLFPDNQKNDPNYTAKEPMLVYLEPIEVEKRSDIFRQDGMPAIVRNFVDLPAGGDREILDTLIDVNKGKTMRVLDFSKHQNHISSSCGGVPRNKTIMEFTEFASLLDSSPDLYAGFETLTPIETVNEMLGFDTRTLGVGYKQNNLFFSSFSRTLMSAGLHCAPCDSVAIQLSGKKTWLLASPQQLSEVPAIPLPTFFPVGFTDDSMLDRFKEFRVVEAGPGDALYFGPSWCHAVITHEDLNIMYNMRYLDPRKVREEQTPKLFLMAMMRYFTRTFGENPQDNAETFGPIYNTINNHYANCGTCKRLEKMIAKFSNRW